MGNKKLRKNLIFDGMSWLKLEMTSYSDNAYDVTIFFCFEKLLAYTLFLPSLIAVRRQMAELNWGGGGFFVLPSKIGLSSLRFVIALLYRGSCYEFKQLRLSLVPCSGSKDNKWTKEGLCQGE